MNDRRKFATAEEAGAEAQSMRGWNVRITEIVDDSEGYEETECWIIEATMDDDPSDDSHWLSLRDDGFVR